LSRYDDDVVGMAMFLRNMFVHCCQDEHADLARAEAVCPESMKDNTKALALNAEYPKIAQIEIETWLVVRVKCSVYANGVRIHTEVLTEIFEI
jgi:hypothetical protein